MPRQSSAPPISDAVRTVVWLGAMAYLGNLVAILAGRPLAEYPVMFPDSYDWLTNGLFYAGVPVDASWRWPLTPLIYSGLFRLRLENAIPFLGPLYLLGTVGFLLTLGRRALGDAAIFAAVLLVTNHFVLPHALVIGSDTLAVTLATGGMLAFFLAVHAKDVRLYLWSGALLGLSLQTQVAAELLLPALLLVYCFDPAAPAGMALHRFCGMATDPGLWAAVAAAASASLAVLTSRWCVTGAFWPVTELSHAGLLGWTTHNLGYYAWSVFGGWSYPVTLLGAVGAWIGWRTPAYRRMFLGLLVAIAVPAAFFVFLYEWRDNRFVLYWTVPAFLLAGLGINACGRFRWVVLAPAAFWGNLAYIAGPANSNPAVVWAPKRAAVMNYATSAIAEGTHPVASYSRTLRRRVLNRRAEFDDTRNDDVYFSRERDLAGSIAGIHTTPGQWVYFDPGPSDTPTAVYMLRNQFALAARRRIEVIELDGAAASTLRAGALVVLRRGEFDRFVSLGWQFDPIYVRQHYAVVRVR